MTPEIEKMARDVGLVSRDYAERQWATDQCDGVIDGGLEAFAQAVAKRCAEICEEAAARLRDRKRVPQVDEHVASVLDEKAAAIRAEFLPAPGQGGG